MKGDIIKISIIVCVCFLFLFPIKGGVLADSDKPDKKKGEAKLENPLGETKEPEVFIGQIVDPSLGVVGSLALLMFVYGGFMWMLAAGNSERVEKGKNILFWATVGLVVIFTSYVIVHFVIFELVGAPSG